MYSTVSSPHRCYILMNDRDNKTYNGYTNDPVKRLRQHNGEISGGAKFTTRHTNKEKDRGVPRRQWSFLAIVESPQFTHHTALSFEWHVKHPTCKRQRPKEYNGANGRLRSLPLVFDHPKFRHMSFVLHVHERYYEKTRSYFATGKQTGSTATTAATVSTPRHSTADEEREDEDEDVHRCEGEEPTERSNDEQDLIEVKEKEEGEDKKEDDVRAYDNVRIVVLAA